MKQVSFYDTPMQALPASPDAWLEPSKLTLRYQVRAGHSMPYAAPGASNCNHVPSPENVRPERLHDFYRSGYQTYPLFVASVPNVTLYSPLMIGFQGDTLLRETVPPWRRQQIDFFLKLSTFTRCVEDVFIDEPVAMLANYSHTNYWHWINQCLVNVELLRLAGVPESVKLLLPASSPDYARQTLELLGVPASRLLQTGLNRVHIRQLLYPSFLEEHGNGRLSPLLQDLYSRLAQPLGQPGAVSGPVYLSRLDTQARRILNEAELIKALEREGVSSISCSKLRVRDQIRMAQETSLLVSPHGAALTNHAFAGALTPVFEIIPRRWGVSSFYSGTQMLHQPHYIFIENQVHDPETGHGMRLQVDIEGVLRSLEGFRRSLEAPVTA
jgi:hypothetical protein